MRGDPARGHGQQPDPQGTGRAHGLPVEGYALIGDGQAAGLVSRNGSVDWLCLPQFDSGACFAALLGTETGWSCSAGHRPPKTPSCSCYGTRSPSCAAPIRGPGSTGPRDPFQGVSPRRTDYLRLTLSG